GNGPSLKRINNNMLINHDVFAVNFFFNNEWFNKLRSVFYFFTDPAIFGDCNKQKLSKQAINEINNLINNTSVKRIIIPFQRKKQWLQSFRSSKDTDKMRYYYSNLEFLSRNTELTLPNGNFCKGQTVVINALLYAMALGYKKIYLLGVDMTGFLVEYEQNSNFQEHSYEKTGSQIEYIDMSSEDNEFYLKIYGKMFEQFKYIKNIADRNNIKILNAAPGGALDVFDRVDFEKIF
ncbi:alpha-2,3-sialyltransferase, partial [Flavobacteriaceae bacterium]|nr:alpha-2,3-sialyltransferase [Flavobacteriaceae bacterium]